MTDPSRYVFLCNLIGFAAYGQLLRSVHRSVLPVPTLRSSAIPRGTWRIKDSGGRAILPRSFASGCHPVAPEAVVGPSKVADGKVKASLETGPPTPHPSSMYGSPDGYRRLWVRAQSNTVRPPLARRPSCFRIPPRRGRHYLLVPLISSASRFEAMRSGKSGRFRNKTAPIGWPWPRPGVNLNYSHPGWIRRGLCGYCSYHSTSSGCAGDVSCSSRSGRSIWSWTSGNRYSKYGSCSRPTARAGTSA